MRLVRHTRSENLQECALQRRNSLQYVQKGSLIPTCFQSCYSTYITPNPCNQGISSQMKHNQNHTRHIHIHKSSASLVRRLQRGKVCECKFVLVSVNLRTPALSMYTKMPKIRCNVSTKGSINPTCSQPCYFSCTTLNPCNQGASS